jgi:hypothetical protein
MVDPRKARSRAQRVMAATLRPPPDRSRIPVVARVIRAHPGEELLEGYATPTPTSRPPASAARDPQCQRVGEQFASSEASRGREGDGVGGQS